MVVGACGKRPSRAVLHKTRKERERERERERVLKDRRGSTTQTKLQRQMCPPPHGGGWPGPVLVCDPPSPHPPPPPPTPPPPRVLKDSGAGANGAKFFVPCLVEGGTMPLVLKTLKTFFLAKTRYRYYRILTSIPPWPQTHTHP